MPTTAGVDDAGRALVVFRLPPEAQLERAWLAGEFNDWSTDGVPLDPQADGSLTVTVPLAPGAYRFRYYLGDGDWENDWAADAYVDNEHGGQDSVVVVPHHADGPPPPVGDVPLEGPAKKAAAKKAPAKKAAAKKKAAARKAGLKKAAAKKKAPPPAD